jgi:hypothetical protein
LSNHYELSDNHSNLQYCITISGNSYNTLLLPPISSGKDIQFIHYWTDICSTITSFTTITPAEGLTNVPIIRGYPQAIGNSRGIYYHFTGMPWLSPKNNAWFLQTLDISGTI